ncbi:hypothetical protein B296_00021162 [Ensete ventricosum]|uniref:Uncharacterized protein n=1 Tax=Ensete ventricosum TaxID=4639 RepID=A0A427AYZ2_ENSVE|nr:hypothetical protein B296_00021162 [Ensete ventricosum]
MAASFHRFQPRADSVVDSCPSAVAAHLPPLLTEPTRSAPISWHHMSLFCEAIAARSVSQRALLPSLPRWNISLETHIRCFPLSNDISWSQLSSSSCFFLLAPAIVAADHIHRNRVTITLFPFFFLSLCFAEIGLAIPQRTASAVLLQPISSLPATAPLPAAPFRRPSLLHLL